MSGPAQANGCTVEVQPNGKTRYTFRQSWLGDYLGLCSERARKAMAGEMIRLESDSTALGSGVHAGIEYAVQSWIDCGVMPPLCDLQEVAVATFDDIVVDNWNKYTPEKAERLVREDVAVWLEEIWPAVQVDVPLQTEWHFETELWATDTIEVWLHGTADLVCEKAIWDWKTAGRKYVQNEKNRAVQSTVYTVACILENFGPGAAWDGLPVPFRYGIMLHDSKQKSQLMTVEKGEGDWQWLRVQLEQLVEMVAADLSAWPLNDDGWFCSAKWCGAWDTCKGAALATQ